jgi:hypothetical protein
MVPVCVKQGCAKPMTFDELWRLNLAREQHPDYYAEEPETAGMHGVRIETANANELKLTAEDYEFLSRVGIKP